jgi:hypothetical protein
MLPRALRGRAGSLSVTGDHVEIERGHDRRRFRRRDVTDGWIEDREGRPFVVLRLRSLDLVGLELEDAAHADALLRAMGAAANQQVLRMPLTSAADRSLAGRFASVLGLLVVAIMGIPLVLLLSWIAVDSSMAATPMAPVSIVIVCLSAWALRLARSIQAPVATIGTDGVSVRGGGWREFVSWADVVSVDATALGVSLRKHDGTRVLLPMWTRKDVEAARQATNRAPSPVVARAEVVCRRIRDAMANRTDAPLARAELELLDRAGRSFIDWTTAVRKLLSTPADYRRVALERDDLVQIVTDAAAAPERRIAAALALSSVEDASSLERIRGAVATCANERLRIAIENAAAGDIDEVEVERATHREVTPLAR